MPGSAFTQALQWASEGPSVARGRPTPDWGQGRATHGGLVAAIALRQMQRRAPAARPVRSLTATFVGPLLAEDAVCRTEVLREGKNSTIIEARIEQGGEACCVAQAVFASSRASVVEVPMRAAPELSPPESYQAMEHVEGLMPAFLRHARLRWAYGNWPLSGTPVVPLGGYCEWLGDDQPDACSLTALLDGWPTPAHSPITTPSGVSTVSWSIDFIADPAVHTYRGPFIYEGSVASASAGHVQGDAWLWNADGTPLARARQLVAIFG